MSSPLLTPISKEVGVFLFPLFSEMKNLTIISVLLFNVYSTLSAQTDTISNLQRIELSDSIVKIDITKSKLFLFSDSLYRFPTFFLIPNSVFIPEKLKPEIISHLHDKSTFEETLNPSQIIHSETFVFYQSGANNSQNLYLSHLQKLNAKNSIFTEYNRNKSDGFYVYQNGISEKLNAEFNLQLTESYILKPFFQYFSHERKENGGIKSDSIFRGGNFTSPSFLESNIINALNTKYSVNGGIIQKIKLKKIELHHRLDYQTIEKIFEYDVSENYYDTTFIDSTATFDKYISTVFSNEISFLYRRKYFLFEPGIQSEYLNYNQNNFDTLSFGNKLFLNSYLSKNNYFLKIKLNYFASGFNKGNYSGEFTFEKNKLSIINHFKFTFFIKNQNPEICFYRMNGNHFLWENSLNPATEIKSYIVTDSKFGNLKIAFETIQGFVFLNENIEVIQSSEKLQKATLNYHFQIDREKVYWRNDFLYQKVFSGSAFFRIPEFTVRSDFKFKTKLKAMNLYQIQILDSPN
jgi:hypothetical protein